MQLYNLYPWESWNPWYAAVANLIVRASDETAARKVAASNCGSEGAEVWLNPLKTICKVVSIDGDEDVFGRQLLTEKPVRCGKYLIGDVLCDMHGDFHGLPDNLEVVSHIRLPSSISRQILNLILIGREEPANKDLTIVGFGPGNRQVVAAYSYDKTMFGLVELRLKSPVPKV